MLFFYKTAYFTRPITSTAHVNSERYSIFLLKMFPIKEN